MNTIVNNKVFAGLSALGVKAFGAAINGVVFHFTIYSIGSTDGKALVDANNVTIKI